MAWTDRYVDAAADGAGNGTTAATSGANGAWTWAQAVAGEAAGQRINVKAGTYARTTTVDTLAAAGTTTAPIWWRGYNATPGDIDSDPISLTKPALTYTTGNLVVSGAHHILTGIDISGAPTSDLVTWSSGIGSLLWRCRMNNTNGGAAAKALNLATNQGARVVHCWLTSPSAVRVLLAGAGGMILGCVLTGATIDSVTHSGGGVPLTLVGNILQGPTSFGLNVSAAPNVLMVYGNLFYGCGSDGLRLASLPTNGSIISNNIFANNGGWGLNNSSGTNTNVVHRFNNAYYNNTSGDENGFGDSPDFMRIDETVSPFVTPGTDFTLLPKALALNAGMGTFENTTLQSFLDIGPMQHRKFLGRKGLAGGF